MTNKGFLSATPEVMLFALRVSPGAGSSYPAAPPPDGKNNAEPLFLPATEKGLSRDASCVVRGASVRDEVVLPRAEEPVAEARPESQR